MVQRMEQTQSPATKDSSLPPSASSQGQELTPGSQELMLTVLEERRSSTPIQSEEEGRQGANLSALESALEVVMTSGTQLPELRDREDPNQSEASGVQTKTDEDNASTVCDVPALPGGDPKVRFAVSRSEEEESTEEASRLVPVELYGYPPFAPETETECEGDTSSEKQPLGPGDTCGTSGGLNQDRLPDLSGRSRAIVKEYFEEASPIRLPVGHTMSLSLSPRCTIFFVHSRKILSVGPLVPWKEWCLMLYEDLQPPCRHERLTFSSGDERKPPDLGLRAIPKPTANILDRLQTDQDQVQRTTVGRPFTKRPTVPLRWT